MGQVKLLKKVPGSKNYKKGKVLVLSAEKEAEWIKKGYAEPFNGTDLQKLKVNAIAKKESTTQAEDPKKPEERLASKNKKQRG